MKLEKKPADGPSMIPVIGSDMKIALSQTPEKGKGNPTHESQTTLNAAKTAISEMKAESLVFFTETPRVFIADCFEKALSCEHLYVSYCQFQALKSSRIMKIASAVIAPMLDSCSATAIV
jgi:hypothetical protein